MKMGTGQTLSPSTQPQIQGTWNENMLLGKGEVRRAFKGIFSSWKIKRQQPDYCIKPYSQREAGTGLRETSSFWSSPFLSQGQWLHHSSTIITHWDHPRQLWPAHGPSCPSTSPYCCWCPQPQFLSAPSDYAGRSFPDYKSNPNSQWNTLNYREAERKGNPQSQQSGQDWSNAGLISTL